MRVALRNPMVGKLGEDFDRVFDRMLVPRFLTEPLLPPFPFENAGAEWIPALDMIETADGVCRAARGPRHPQGEPGRQPHR